MKFTIQEFNKQFPDNDACLDYLFKVMHGEDKCPACKRISQYHRRAGSSHYVCNCGQSAVSPKAGTIFEKSRTDLYKWFYAIFLMSQHKNGVSAKTIQSQVGVTYKCAWRMMHEIRKLMDEKGNGTTSGTFEADETYIGGKRRGTRGRGATGKTAVFGVVKRQEGVVARAVPNVKRSTVMSIVRENVAIGATLMTDEFNIYAQAGKEYVHETVNHGRKEYVRGNAHTNTIEGFWSQLKRSLHGTYHSVSPKHLQAYVDEFAYRYNHRQSEVPMFALLLSRLGA